MVELTSSPILVGTVDVTPLCELSLMKDVKHVVKENVNDNSVNIQQKLNSCDSNSVRAKDSGLGVRIGFRRSRTVPNKDYFLCCEGWSNAVLGIGWLDYSRKIFVYQEGFDTKLMQKILPDRACLLDRREALNKIDDLHTISIVVGTLLFVEDFLNESERFPLLRTLVTIPYCRFRKKELLKSGLKWVKVNHNAIGGVTTSAWSMGFPRRFDKPSLNELSPSFGLERSLKHIYKDGGMGKAVTEPKENKLNHLLSLKELRNGMFILPSFQSYSGWVERKLENFEKGLALDFNELMLNKIILATGLEAEAIITEPRLVLSQKIVAKKEGCGPPEGSSIMPVPGSS